MCHNAVAGGALDSLGALPCLGMFRRTMVDVRPWCESVQRCGCSGLPSLWKRIFPFPLILPKMVYQTFYIAENITKSKQLLTAKKRENGRWGGDTNSLSYENLLVTLYHSWSEPMPLGAVGCESQLGELLKSHWCISHLSPRFPGPQSARIKASLRDGFIPPVREKRGKGS